MAYAAPVVSQRSLSDACSVWPVSGTGCRLLSGIIVGATPTRTWSTTGRAASVGRTPRSGEKAAVATMRPISDMSTRSDDGRS